MIYNQLIVGVICPCTTVFMAITVSTRTSDQWCRNLPEEILTSTAAALAALLTATNLGSQDLLLTQAFLTCGFPHMGVPP